MKDSRFIRVNELIERLSVSRSTIWRWERAGRFPKRKRIGPNVAGWYSHDLEEWLPTAEEKPTLSEDLDSP